MEFIKIKSKSDIIKNLPKIEFDNEILLKVTEIVNDVSLNGDSALRKYSKMFDGVDLESFEVYEDELQNAYKSVDDDFLKTLDVTVENIEKYQKIDKGNSWLLVEKDGYTGQIQKPLENVGLYIPGGTAPLISTILMSAIPAYIAGVKNIYVFTPPDKEGNVNPYILTAAKKCRVKKIFKVGGAQAVAAMAYGTETIPKVDKIIGPGNIFVTYAKKIVYGLVDIDMIAGPSEILILADETAQKNYVIADLLSQAEHDKLAKSYLVTTSKDLAEYVKENIYKVAESNKRYDFIKESLKDNGKIFLVEDLETAIYIVNKIAPEHLEIILNEGEQVLNQIENAGAIFMGNYTPEPVGDYFAGPSHILPTGGTARFFSPITVGDFIKKTSLIKYSKEKLEKNGNYIMDIAKLESLESHYNSVKVRLEN